MLTAYFFVHFTEQKVNASKQAFFFVTAYEHKASSQTT